MQSSIFIARLVGPVMLVAGLSVLLNRQNFRSFAEQFLESRALLFLAGLVVMSAGLAIVLAHNVWTGDWRTLVTLFGWLLVLGGAVRVIGPPFLYTGARAFLRRPAAPMIAGGAWVALGLLFCLLGYVH